MSGLARIEWKLRGIAGGPYECLEEMGKAVEETTGVRI